MTHEEAVLGARAVLVVEVVGTETYGDVEYACVRAVPGPMMLMQPFGKVLVPVASLHSHAFNDVIALGGEA